MKVKLSDDEREYLADKTFWDWKRAEADVLSIPLLFKDNKKATKKILEAEKFYKDLYNKLKLEEEDGRKSKNGRDRKTRNKNTRNSKQRRRP